MSLRKNLTANYFGQGWSALIGLLLVPIYVRYLGLESYGLIGFFAILLAWFTLFDLGMSPTVNRELARYTGGIHKPGAISDLVYTFELICLSLSTLIFFLVLGGSNWVADSWLSAAELSPRRIRNALVIMGFVAALRFQEGFYRAAILGFQRHVWLNLISAILATIRGVGAILVLIYIDSTIEAFFLWQALISVMTLIILRWRLKSYMPYLERKAKFVPSDLRESWHFARGIFVTTILAIAITQVDKVMLSRMLSLEKFGIYTFATTIVGVLTQLITPITQSYSPRFSELVARDAPLLLISSYHQAAQLVSCILVPASLVLVFYVEPLILIWTGDKDLAGQVATIVPLLTLGTIFNGFMHIPYILQLAYGWTRLSVIINCFAVLLVVPALLLVVPSYGVVGASLVWAAINLLYFVVTIHIMHRRFLVTEKWRWYFQDILAPLVASAGVCLVLQQISFSSTNPMLELISIVTASMFSLLAAMLATATGRKTLFSLFRVFK